MEKRILSITCSVLALIVISLTGPSYAGFMSERIDEGVYLVSYERGRLTSGSVLDTAKKAKRKLIRKSHEFCLTENYAFMRFPSLAEISQDEQLRAVWDLFAGDEAADSFQTAGGDLDGGYSKTHKTRRILLLSNTEEDGFERCVDKKHQAAF